jgi:thiol-disulfide isomerase/thioredoxin
METVKAAEDGTWAFDAAPDALETIEVGAWSHQADIGHGTYPITAADPVALRNGTAKMTLERGVPIEGTVYGADRKPLAKASIGTGGDRVPSNAIPVIRTDENGQFFLRAKPGELLVLTVKADKHAPDLKQLTVAAKNEPLEFHLEAGKTMKGKVVDADGKPVEGVTLYADTWRGNRTLGNRLTTRSDGSFEWKGAPADAVMMDIMKIGYADLRGHAMTASDQELLVTLNKPLVVRGRVVDAETGKPVESFKVVKGIAFDDNRIHWQRREGRDEVSPKSDGTFEFEQSYPYPGYAVRVEADGYTPGDSRIFRLSERNVELSFKLEKGKPVEGVVRKPDGSPAAGAQIAVATKDQGAYVVNGTTFHDQGNVKLTADAQGKYKLPVLTGDYALVAIQDAGYGELQSGNIARDGTDVKLQAWGKVDGTITVGTKPGAGSELSLFHMDERYDANAPRIHHQIESRADGEGRFTFERVRPGKVSVSRTVRRAMSASSWMNGPTHTARAEVKSGETTTVKLGGTGRPVTGRITIPPEVLTEPVWVVSEARLMTAPTKMEIPGFKDVPSEDREKWLKEFMASEAGKAYQEAVNKQNGEFRMFTMLVEKDGSFRADDIPAGKYNILVTLSRVNKQGTCGPGDELASGGKEIIVPEMPAGRSDEPLVVESIGLALTNHVDVGEVAPSFAFKTLDGKEAKLEDYKGKFVFLDFWATWCGPCVAETPNLKAAFNDHGGDPRFVMIGLSLDADVAEPKKYAENNETKWMQGHLGDWSNSPVPALYGFKGIPATFLIGPDGKVIAKNLRGPAMTQAIGKAMGK